MREVVQGGRWWWRYRASPLPDDVGTDRLSGAVQPRGVSTLRPQPEGHQGDWEDTLESLAVPEKRQLQLTGPYRRKVPLETAHLFSSNLVLVERLKQ